MVCLMMKVDILEELHTKLGHTLIINSPGEVIKVGDSIETNNGENYIIKGISMPTKPDINRIALIV